MTITRGIGSDLIIACNERESRQIGMILAKAASVQARLEREDKEMYADGLSAQANINSHFCNLFNEWANMILDLTGL